MISNTDLALSAPLDKMDAHRIAAIDSFLKAADLIAEGYAHLEAAAPSNPYAAMLDRSLLEKIGGRHASDQSRFRSGIEQHANTVVWRHVFGAGGLERLLDSRAKEELREQIANAPPPTPENIRATMAKFHEDRAVIFQRGLATAFSSLDRRFRSHDGFKIGSRIVLTRALGLYGSWCHYARRDDTLRDVERAFYLLDGKSQPERDEGIVGLIDVAKRGLTERPTFVVESDYFRVRGFKNGNLHVHFQRADLVEKVNLQLAAYYGAVLGDRSSTASGPAKSRAPVPGCSFYPTPAPLAAQIIEEAGIRPGMTVLEPSAGNGALAYPAAAAGGVVTAIELQLSLAADLGPCPTRLSRVIVADFLRSSPQQLGHFDRIVMNPPFEGGRDIEHVTHALRFLKPGGVLMAIVSAGVAFKDDRATVAFRELVERAGGHIRDLPAGSFAASGTNVNTCLVRITTRPLP